MNGMPSIYDAFDAFISNKDIMRTDVYEKDGYYILDIELAGYDKADIDIKVKNGYLTVSANHNIQEDSNGEMISNERFFGSCSRNYYIGEGLTSEDVSAKFDNGILTVSILKNKPEPESSLIEIE